VTTDLVPHGSAAQLAHKLAELERKIANLETARPSQFTEVYDPQGNLLIKLSSDGLQFFDTNGNQIARLDGTGLRVFNDSGNQIARLDGTGVRVFDNTGQVRSLMGFINASVGYGFRVRDASGGLRASVVDNGWHDPWLSHPWRAVITPQRQSTTSGSFQTLWTSSVQLITHGGAAVDLAWVTDAATTGELRMQTASGNTTAVSLPAGSSGGVQYRWLHGSPLGSGPVGFNIQARRTGGGGDVHLDAPFSALAMADMPTAPEREP
jgi:hypothetical protein